MTLWSLTALTLILSDSHRGYPTSFFVRPMTERIQTTEVIVRGVPIREAATWMDQSGRRTIVTVSEVDVLEVLKGSIQERTIIEIIRDGGSLDGVSVEVPGTAALPIGQEVVLFLIQSEGRYRVRGMSVGVFSVKDGQIIGATGDSAGAIVHHGESQNVTGSMALDELKVQIKLANSPVVTQKKVRSTPARETSAPKLHSDDIQGDSLSVEEGESESNVTFYWILAITAMVGVMLFRRSRA